MKEHSKYIYSILTILIVSFTLSIIIRYYNDDFVFIDGDGSGHYAWLPSIIFHNTLDFETVFNEEKLRKGQDYQGHNYHRLNNITINKFPPGSALLMLPFFMLAYLISLIIGIEIDSHSLIFQLSVGLAAVFWAFIGLYSLFKLLLTYKLSRRDAIIITLATLLGTNLFAYIFIMPAFSHVYSFSMISILIYHIRKYFLLNQPYDAIISAIAIAVVLIIRPVNILVLFFIPFLASNYSTFINSIRKKISSRVIIYCIINFFFVLLPYFLINYLQTGRIIYFAYTNEGFYFDRPELINFLFSFRKGWFIYSPLYLLIIPSFYYLFKRNKYQFYWGIGFFIFLTYIFSSWWNWFYGDSFGMRPMVDFSVVFTLIIALYYKNITNYIKSITLGFIIIVTLLNLVQTYQYSRGIIHPDSMNKEAYFHVFLRTDKSYSGVISGSDEYYYGEMNENAFLETFNDFEKEYAKWSKLWSPENTHTFSGKNSIKFSETQVYSPAFKWVMPDTLVNASNLYIKISAMLQEPDQNSAGDALFIMDIQDEKANTVFYKKTRLKRIPNNSTMDWYKVSTGFKLPQITSRHHKVKIYIWNPKASNFYLDDIKISFYKYHN